MIRYKCPSCGIPLENPESTVGQYDSCPMCNASHVVPSREPVLSDESKAAAKRAAIEGGKVAGKAAKIAGKIGFKSLKFLGKAAAATAAKSADAAAKQIEKSKEQAAIKQDRIARKAEIGTALYFEMLDWYTKNFSASEQKENKKYKPTPNQMDYLKKLDYHGIKPENYKLASLLITFINRRGGRDFFDLRN